MTLAVERIVQESDQSIEQFGGDIQNAPPPVVE